MANDEGSFVPRFGPHFLTSPTVDIFILSAKIMAARMRGTSTKTQQARSPLVACCACLVNTTDAAMRIIPRRVEASIGGTLLRVASQKGLKDSKLVQKSVFLPRSAITMHYLERGPEDASLTLLFCHGLSDKAVNMAPFITSLNIPSNVRVLVPDAIGHGQDLRRVQSDASFQQPSPTDQLDAIIELLEVLNVKDCNAFGYSLGGALVYFLRQKRPDLVHKTVLLSPAMESCLDQDFVEKYKSGENRFIRIDSRSDVKQLFRDMSVPHRTKKDPIPKFFLEAIYRQSKREVPEGHWEEMMNALLEYSGTDEVMSATYDVDKDSPRVVIWPEHDSICSFEKGKAFFVESSATEFLSVPDCGHLFLSDGTFLLSYAAPSVSKFLSDDDNGEENAVP